MFSRCCCGVSAAPCHRTWGVARFHVFMVWISSAGDGRRSMRSAGDFRLSSPRSTTSCVQRTRRAFLPARHKTMLPMQTLSDSGARRENLFPGTQQITTRCGTGISGRARHAGPPGRARAWAACPRTAACRVIGLAQTWRRRRRRPRRVRGGLPRVRVLHDGARGVHAVAGGILRIPRVGPQDRPSSRPWGAW